MADEVKALWGQYLSNLQRYPLRTKAITAGVLAGSADVVAQKLAGAKNLQLRRSLLLMLYGFCYSGPFGHYFHKFMERLFPVARDTKTIASKVIVEQLTSGPWNNFLFITYLGMVVEGRPWSSVKSQLKSNFPAVQLNAWRFWPLVGLINYKYLPIQLRVLFHNLAAVCWGCFYYFVTRQRFQSLPLLEQGDVVNPAALQNRMNGMNQRSLTDFGIWMKCCEGVVCKSANHGFVMDVETDDC